MSVRTRRLHSGELITRLTTHGATHPVARAIVTLRASRLASCKVGRWSAHICDARTLKDGADMCGVVSTGFPC